MHPKRTGRRRRAKWAAGALSLTVLGFAGWLGLSAVEARSGLEQARASAAEAKDALLRGDAEQAPRLAVETNLHAERARKATHSGAWTIAAAVPFLGSPFETGRQISDVVAGLASDVLQPAARIGAGLSATKLINANRVDVQFLRTEQPRLDTLAQAANRLEADAEAIPDAAYLGAVRDARKQLQSQTADLARLLDNTALAARLGPSMLGADGPRTYLMAFQTNAEARATGGLLGGFGILRFDNGTPTVDMLAPNTELSTASAAIDLGPEFNDQYGWANAYTDFRNSNLSPHFPYAAQIWKAMWEGQADVKVDAVIAIDPVALSYILGATGPITMSDGEVVTADNVVELTESTAYFRFPTDQEARKEYLQAIATAVVRKITAGVNSPSELLGALGRAVGERRLALWTAYPEDQKLLEETELAHIVPDDSAPYAQVVINNLAGNKMDYYLRRDIEYTAGGCDLERRPSAVRVRLTNTAAADNPLPDYVAGTGGIGPDVGLDLPSGTMVTSVSLLATKGARLDSVESKGRRLAANITFERGHPRYEVQVVIPPGQSGELSFRISEPVVPGAARLPEQPLIDDAPHLISVPVCS